MSAVETKPSGQAHATDPTQTRRSFREKWANSPDAAFASTNTEGSTIQNWILNRNGFDTLEDLRAHIADRTRILDGGCGNGRVTALLSTVAAPGAEVMGIDLNADAVASANLAGVENIRVRNADLLGDLSDIGPFDFIYCQEVLHHTEDPQGGFDNLVSRLVPGGEIAIYVYRKKAPIREYTDDFVREAIKDMSYEEGMEVSAQITELGKRLSELDATVEVPDIPVLGITGGEHHVQRLLYHFFMKAFWNPELSYHDNVVVNFDWYHPSTCSRHTVDEVEGWYRVAGLDIVHSFEDEYGITVRGVKPA